MELNQPESLSGPDRGHKSGESVAAWRRPDPDTSLVSMLRSSHFLLRKATLGVGILPLLLGVGFLGCGGSHREVRTTVELPSKTAPEPSEGVRHMVQAGQTLWRISRVYEVPLGVLAEVNGLDDPSSLSIGQTLFVPGATAIRDVPTEALFDWPIADSRILSGFGVSRPRHRHKGIDLGGKRGQPVHAARSGRVVYSGSTLRGYGKTVIIDHGSDLRSLYAHNSALLVHKGQSVDRGQAIARVGQTGNASTEHCHFEIRMNDVPVDPMRYLVGRTEQGR